MMEERKEGNALFNFWVYWVYCKFIYPCVQQSLLFKKKKKKKKTTYI